MKVIFYICVLVLLLNLAGAQTEISEKTIFKELVYSDKGKAVFMLNNSDSILSGDSLQISFNEVCGHVVNYKIYINSTCSRQDPVYSIKKECYNISVYDNNTLNDTIHEVCSNVSFISDYKNVSFLCEIELKTIPKNLSRIRIDAEIQYEMCEDGRFGYKIDWIPSLTTSDKKIYSEISWAWWNASYAQRINVTNLSESNIGIHLNLTAGFCGYRVLFNPSQCGSSDIAFYYNTCDFVLICNSSSRMNIEVTTNSSLSYQNTSVYSLNTRLYTPYDISASVMLDRTSNKINGAVSPSGVSFNSSGKFGGALDFSGATSYVSYGSALTNTLNYTILMWIKPVSWGNMAFAMAGYSNGDPKNEWGLYSYGGKMRVQASNGSAYNIYEPENYDSTNYPSTNYTFIAGTVDGTAINFYKNGNKIGAGYTQTLNQSGTAYGFAVGRMGDHAGYYYVGAIDEVMVFNYSLSAYEISEVFNQSVGTKNILASNESCIQNRTNTSFINNTLCINHLYNGTVTEFDNSLCPFSVNITYNFTDVYCSCNNSWSNISVVNLTNCVNFTWNVSTLQTDISLCNLSNQTVYDYDVYCNVSCIPDPYSSAWILNYSTECINNSYTNFYYRYEWDNNNCTIFLDYFFMNETVSCGEDLHNWFDVNFALLINIIFFTLILIGILWALGKLMER